MIDIFNTNEEKLAAEVSRWEHSDANKGQIYTRPEVVNFMLTVAGLHDGIDLKNIRVLEPSCGDGEFVVAVAKRLIGGREDKPTKDQLMGKILAIDLVGDSVEIAKARVGELLINYGYSKKDKNALLNDWFSRADFLLEDIKSDFTHVIGNPPYVRVENIPKRLLSEYRKKFSTMTDRADLYIPFFEKALSLLVDGGKLTFICTDRWTKNIYGASLRKLISEKYSLELFLEIYGANAFESDVMTYPAITQIAKTDSDRTVLITESSFTHGEAVEVLEAINGASSNIQLRKGIVDGGSPWLIATFEQKALIRKLESKYPALEETGCKVYIGAATGANKVYVVHSLNVDIEESRLLPVVTANELKSGSLQWNGKYIINTYDKNGIINLEEFPKLEKYLNQHKELLCNRHVAKLDTAKWFKTIDRVYEERASMEKLLIPDISSQPVVIYDKGQFHPNNSIYYISSDNWNLHALRVVLLSGVTKLFISSYSTKIANGYLRFQAQHLRKLRLPLWSGVEDKLKAKMIEAGMSNDVTSFTELTCEMYGLNKKEIKIVGG